MRQLNSSGKKSFPTQNATVLKNSSKPAVSIQITGRRVTYEYLLIAGLNDSPKHAEKLASLIGGMLSNVNLIPYNLVEGRDFRRPDERTIDAFKAVLTRRGIEAVEREERGHSAAAACGQLRGDITNKRR